MDWSEPEDYLGIDWNPKGQEHHPYNCMPMPYKEIELEDFLGHMFYGTYLPIGQNYKSVFVPGDKCQTGAQIFLFPSYCLAVTRHGWGSSKEDGEKGGGMAVEYNPGWYIGLRFWRLGCTHPNMTTTWPRMFDRRDYCPDCGYEQHFDTSG